jgi:hypothetical protein
MVPFFAWHAIFFLTRRLGVVALRSPIQLAEGLWRYLATTFAGPGRSVVPAGAVGVFCRARAVLPIEDAAAAVDPGGLPDVRHPDALTRLVRITADYGLIKTSTYWVFFSVGYACSEWKISLAPTKPLWRWLPRSCSTRSSPCR